MLGLKTNQIKDVSLEYNFSLQLDLGQLEPI